MSVLRYCGLLMALAALCVAPAPPAYGAESQWFGVLTTMP